MKFTDNKKSSGVDVNLTPLIDVVFLLLIFFMVSTTFIYSDALKIQLPKAKGENAEIKDNINIVVTSNGEISINGDVISKAGLESKLRSLKEQNPEATVILQADKSSTHGDVVFVMDYCKRVGFDKLAIATENR
jgi:biopolymer transport protein ExbD